MELDFDVVDLPAADPPESDDRAPDFTRPLVNDEYWEDVPLSEAVDDGHLLLVFYPMNGSFPATYVWQEVRDRGWNEMDDVEVVGVTASTPYSHEQLLQELEVDVRLYSDPANTVAEMYGVEHDLDGMTGVSEPRPAVFLLDRDLTVEYSWVAGEWPEFPPYDEMEEELEDL